MRCPKCGFISFDHLTSCAKCGKDISGVASELQGTSIKVETPMFLSSALASFADRGEGLEEHAMEEGEGIDFSMAEEGAEEEAVQMNAPGEDIDFSFEAQEAGADSGPAEGGKESANITSAAGAEEKAEVGDESFEELDFMGVVDEEDEGGLEFDLEDFIEDLDEDKTQESGSGDVDIDLDEEEK